MDTEKLIREVLEFSAKTGFGTKTSIKEATEEFLLANPKYRSRKPAEQRLADFVNEIAKFKEKYDRELLVKFYNHWSQKGEKDLKFHWEKQKTFEVGKRLASFKANQDSGFGRNAIQQQRKSEVEQNNSNRPWNSAL